MLRLDVHGSPIKITGSGAYGTTPLVVDFFPSTKDRDSRLARVEQPSSCGVRRSGKVKPDDPRYGVDEKVGQNSFNL